MNIIEICGRRDGRKIGRRLKYVSIRHANKHARPHRIPIPYLDDFSICAENHAVAGHAAPTLQPCNAVQRQPVPLVFRRKRLRRAYVIEQRVPRRRADRIRQPVRARRNRSHPQRRHTRPVVDPGERRAPPRTDPHRHVQHADGRARAGVPKLHARAPVEPEREQAVRGVHVDAVDTRRAREHERAQEAALCEVEAVDLVACAGDERVARGGVVRERTAEARDAGAVVEAALRVECEGAVVLEVDRLGPVVGQDLGWLERKNVLFGRGLTRKSTFSASPCRSNLRVSSSRSQTRIWGL